MTVLNKTYLFLLLMLLLKGSTSFTQSDTTWNLEKCLEYATTNNLDIKIASLSLSQSELNKNQSKYSYLPVLNAGATHGYNWGQRIDPFTNQFATDRVRSNSLYLSSSVNLFSGLKNYYTNQKNNSEYLVGFYNKEIQKRNLKIDVSALFLQTLMNYKTTQIAKEQMGFSISQRNRIRELVKEKHKTNYDLLKVESQLGLDSLAFVKAKNEYKLSILRLKQFLNLKPQSSFEIDTSFVVNNSASVATVDVSKLDENLLTNEQLNLQTQNLKIAKSGRSPSLTLSGSLGTGYSGNNKELVGTEFLPKPFNIQAQENFYQTVNLSLTVPIFNKNQVNTQINRANIELRKAQVQGEKTRLEIENKIAQLHIEIDNTTSQISANEKALTSLKENFKIATLKYEEGIINYTQFLEAKNDLIKTEIELLQAQFAYVFKVEILELYRL